MQDELMRPYDVKRLLGVSDITLRRWHRSGRLVAVVRTLGGHMRYLRSEVEALVARSAPRSLVGDGQQSSTLEEGTVTPIPLTSPADLPPLQDQFTEEDVAFLSQRKIPIGVADEWLLRRVGLNRDEMRKYLNEVGRIALARRLNISTADLRLVCKRFAITLFQKRLPPWIPPHLRKPNERS